MLLEFDFTAWVVGLATLGLFLIVMRRRSKNYLFFLSFFWIYLLVVISLTFFPIPLQGSNPSGTFQQQIQFMQHVHALNLWPLNFDACWEFPRSCFNNLVGNILLTLPFGFGIKFLFHPSSRDYIWVAFAIGLAIEGLQFMLNLATGSAFRTVDVNDVLLNALGTWIGYGCFLVVTWFFKHLIKFTPGWWPA